MPKKESTLVNALLFGLYAAGGVLSMVMVSPYERGRRLRRKYLYGLDSGSLANTFYNLRRRGLVVIFKKKNGERFVKLTEKGQLEILLAKARLPSKCAWDGKWRLIVFDIPEGAKLQREQFRGLLKKNNYHKLQDSVYINPYPLNREAVLYLQRTGLMQYIRILKVEEMDNDKDLRKKFNL